MCTAAWTTVSEGPRAQILRAGALRGHSCRSVYLDNWIHRKVMTVTENQPAHHGHEAIREVCETQSSFDELEFGTLLNEADGFLTITGSVDVPALEGDIALTLWRAARDEKDDMGMPAPLWLRVVGSSQAGDGFTDVSPVDPDADDLGLIFPESFRTAQLVDACRTLLKLLMAASLTDHGLTGEAREANFEQLEEAVQDGFDAADPWVPPTQADFSEDDSALSLHSYCENGSFVSVSFGTGAGDGFVTSAVVPTVAGDVRLAAWFDPVNGENGDLELMLDVEDRVQRMPDDLFNAELHLPWGPGIPREQVRMALQYLKPVHLHALKLYEEYDGDVDGVEVCAALTALATNALREGYPLPLDVFLSGGGAMNMQKGPRWHQAMDVFTEQCRLGLLAGVVVEESPHRNLNIRATALDPVTGGYVPLQVYWQEPQDGSDPAHWLAVGEKIHPAHDGDPLYPELLAGLPRDSKEHIRHAIDHLHEMVHLATDVVNGKVEEVTEVLVLADTERAVPDVVGGHMQAEAIEDALGGLNGVARLYTGSTDRDVRNS